VIYRHHAGLSTFAFKMNLTGAAVGVAGVCWQAIIARGIASKQAAKNRPAALL
jgi:hypothetical protein